MPTLGEAIPTEQSINTSLPANPIFDGMSFDALAAAVINWKRPLADLGSPSRSPASHCSPILAANGWALLPPISSEQVEDIRQYLADKPVVLRDHKVMPLSRVPPDCTIADYPLKTVLGSPHFFEIANAPINIETATTISRLPADHFDSRDPVVTARRP